MNIEIDLSDHDFPDKEFPNCSYTYLETEGETLKELIDNAWVFLTDQDGGETGDQSIGESDYHEEFESLIRFEYTKSYSTLKDGMRLYVISGGKND